MFSRKASTTTRSQKEAEAENTSQASNQSSSQHMTKESDQKQQTASDVPQANMRAAKNRLNISEASLPDPTSSDISAPGQIISPSKDDTGKVKENVEGDQNIHSGSENTILQPTNEATTEQSHSDGETDTDGTTAVTEPNVQASEGDLYTPALEVLDPFVKTSSQDSNIETNRQTPSTASNVLPIPRIRVQDVSNLSSSDTSTTPKGLSNLPNPPTTTPLVSTINQPVADLANPTKMVSGNIGDSGYTAPTIDTEAISNPLPSRDLSHPVPPKLPQSSIPALSVASPDPNLSLRSAGMRQRVKCKTRCVVLRKPILKIVLGRELTEIIHPHVQSLGQVRRLGGNTGLETAINPLDGACDNVETARNLDLSNLESHPTIEKKIEQDDPQYQTCRSRVISESYQKCYELFSKHSFKRVSGKKQQGIDKTKGFWECESESECPSLPMPNAIANIAIIDEQ